MTDSPQNSPHPPPAVCIDWQAFLPYLNDSDLSEQDKRAFVETLWSIVLSFVDLGYGLNPTQEICGEVIDLNRLFTGRVADVLDCPHIPAIETTAHSQEEDRS